MKSIPKNRNSANHNPNNFAMALRLDLDPFQHPQNRLVECKDSHCGLEQSIETIQPLHEFEGNANKKELLCLTRHKPTDTDKE